MPRHRHKKHTYESLSEESEHLPVSKRQRKNKNKKATILTSFNDKSNKQAIIAPPTAAFVNENENERKSENPDMWQLGLMISGVEYKVEFGVFSIFSFYFHSFRRFYNTQKFMRICVVLTHLGQ